MQNSQTYNNKYNEKEDSKDMLSQFTVWHLLFILSVTANQVKGRETASRLRLAYCNYQYEV